MRQTKSKQSDILRQNTPDMTSMMNNQAFETLSEFYATTTKNFATVNEEITRFVTSRLKEDIEAQKAIATAESPADAFQKYSSFVQDSFRQYIDEMNKLGKVMSDLNRKSIKAAADPADKRTAHAAE